MGLSLRIWFLRIMQPASSAGTNSDHVITCLRVSGLGFEFWVESLRVWGLGFGIRVRGLGFGV
jgi:hypothetical protein